MQNIFILYIINKEYKFQEVRVIKNKSLAFAVMILCFLFTMGCSNNNNQTSENTDSKTNNINIYDNLIAANEKYGSKKEQICKSNFKCEPSEISEKVIIAPTWEVDIFTNHVDSIKHISGPTGHGYDINQLYIKDKKITYITTGVGACNLMDAVLALGCTPCKEILFIGAVGALDKDMKIGDIVIPEYSICGIGADRYLTSGNVSDNDCYGKKYYPDKEISDEVLKFTNEAIKDTDIKVHMGKIFSCDTIFAEYAHLDEFIKEGCNIIEMETATLFHSANIAGIKASALLNVSDNTIANKSLYNGRTEEDQQRRSKVKKDIIPTIALKTLKII